MSNQDSQDELRIDIINCLFEYNYSSRGVESGVPEKKFGDEVMALINSHTQTAVATAENSLDHYWNKKLEKAVTEAIDKTHYTLLEQFNKADEEALPDIEILTNSDSWHEVIKRIKAELTEGKL